MTIKKLRRESGLKEFRRKSGLTQEQMAVALGVCSRSIRSWERGKTPSRLAVVALDALAEKYQKKGK